MHRSLDIVALTQYLKDWPTLALLDETKWDLPMGTKPNMLVGNKLDHWLAIHAAPYPRRFRPPTHISKYDGETKLDHWLEDY